MTKKYAFFGLCALAAGGVAASMVKDSASPDTTTALNSLGGGTLCYMGADQYYSAKTEQQLTDAQRIEGVLTKSMEKPGRYILDYSSNDTVFGPTRIKTKCEGKPGNGGMLCTGADGTFGDCSTSGFVYVTPNWAFQIAAFYSADGCFEGPYTEPSLVDFSRSLYERQKKK
jgi:hypothetical protein